MRAMDVMTQDVITVGPNASVSEIAALLLRRHISGVPVVDGSGKLVGMVSEGDLVRRVETGTERHRSWWLEQLTENSERASIYVKTHGRKASDVMTTDVVTALEQMQLREIASVMERHRIKRVPILRAGKIVGIVAAPTSSRALPPMAIVERCRRLVTRRYANLSCVSSMLRAGPH